MPPLGTRLSALLREHATLYSTSHCQSAVRQHCGEADGRTPYINRVDDWSERLRASDPLSVALAAWEAGPNHPQITNDPDTDRFLDLRAALSALDRTYRSRPLERLPDGDFDLVVGERWWENAASPYASRYVDGYATADYAHAEAFPHLARGRVRRDHWCGQPSIRDAFAPLAYRDSLNVGLVTLTAEQSTRFEGTVVTDPGQLGFQATGVADSVLGYLVEVAEWARQEHVHILFLPELSLDDTARNTLCKLIEDDPGELRLVLPGSFHTRVEGSEQAAYNQAPVWLVERGADTSDPQMAEPQRKVPSPPQARVRPIALIDKREQFPLPFDPESTPPTGLEVLYQDAHAEIGIQRLREDTIHDSRRAFVNTGLGVVSALICKDILVAPPQYGDPQPTDTLRVADHLGVLSMNVAPDAWFEAPAKLAVRQFLAATYYINVAYDWVPSGTVLAFWLLPRARPLLSSTPDLSRPPFPSPPPPRALAFYRDPSSAPCGELKAALWPETGCVAVRIATDPADAFSHQI